MCVSPGLLNVTHSTIPLKQVTGSVNVGSCTLFAMRKISAILSVDQVLNPQTKSNSLSSALPASESSLRANSISLLYCPELLPLILLCHSEDDHTIAAEALQLLALHSNSSIVRWSKISQSQLSTAIWTVRDNSISLQLLVLYYFCAILRSQS